MFTLSLLLVSCVNDDNGEFETQNLEEIQKSFSKPIARLEENVADNILVPYKKGFVTIVMYDGDTLAVTSKEGQKMSLPEGVKLPSTPSTYSTINKSISNRAAEVEATVTYEKVEDYHGIENLVNSWRAIMFEDTKNGDFDYNDLIIQAYYNFHKAPWPSDDVLLDIHVQGIALGSSKTIKLGVYTQTGKQYISQDVRKDIFSKEELAVKRIGDLPYFINTDSVYVGSPDSLYYFKRENKITCDVTDLETDYVVWFIEATDNKTHITDTFLSPTSVKLSSKVDRVNMFSEHGQPYSIVKKGIISTYPIEGVSINKIYPNFFNWIDGSLDGLYDEVAIKIPENRDFFDKNHIQSWKIWKVINKD